MGIPATESSRKDSVLYWLICALFRGPTIFRWGLALVCTVFPPIYLAYRPTKYTPLVDAMFSIFLFILAYWVGYSGEVARATEKASDRWLPQAESVIFRLMTLHANVRRFGFTTRATCASAECELPELKEEGLRAVRIKIKSDCDSYSQRLEDIAYQLEDAIEDWRRFIGANCHGDECERIFEALEQRQTRLECDMATCDAAEHFATAASADATMQS